MKPQHLQALDRANEIRLANAATCHEIEALPTIEAKRKVVRILRSPDEKQLRLRVDRLLCSVRGIGKTKARRILRDAGIRNEIARIGEITARQRYLVACVLVGKETIVGRHGFVEVASW